ncbi:MAG TPA: 16S rRNA (uracil(1498)-N(3))-methyltransferase [Bacillota bacterium]
MTRFFIPTSQIRGNEVILEGADHRHLVKVLRKTVGAEIQVLTGKGEEFKARIIAIGPDRTVAELDESIRRQTEPRLKIRLVQSLPKAAKFEWIIQKNTELGVSSFQPVLSERSLIRLERDTKVKKQERWQKIIKEAAQQSGRQIIPDLQPVLEWEEFIAAFPAGLVLIPWEAETGQSLKTVLKSFEILPEEITVIIGPEGGFAQNEVEQVRQLGAIPVSLGPRILRTETAGLVAATALLYHFGELD